MRILVILVTALGLTLEAFASKGVTVAELERTLAAAQGKSDAEVSRQLSGFELTQRLSTSHLARLQSTSPGVKTSQELSILADQSAFLSLPAAEIPAIATPDQATQRQIMGLVVNYVTTSAQRLPDFMATRATSSFEDRPAGLFDSLPLNPVGNTTASVVYRDGKEVDTNARGKKTKGAPGLSSWGEFGPILSTVLLDAAQSQLAWSHWEQVAGARRAVFRYAVPAEKSHYEVQFCCRSSQDEKLHQYAAYHGEIAVDSASGAILRLTAIAELHPGDEEAEALVTASIAVEYGPVAIAGKSYICPVKSVAIAQRRQTDIIVGPIAAQAAAHAPLITLLNNVDFERYHVFRSETRILTGGEAENSAENSNDAPSDSSPTSASPAETATAPVAPEAPAKPETAPPAPATQTGLPAVRAEEPPANQAPLIKTTSREVVVDVVVTKGNGDAVPGLSKQDFEVSEDGKPQTVDFFQEHSGNAPPGTPPEMPAMPAGMHTNVPPAPLSDAVNVLLIDTLNTGLQEQAFVRKSVMDFLGKMQPGTRMAIFALGSKLRCIQGFTTDSSALLAALNDSSNGLSGKKSAYLKTSSDQADDAGNVAALQAMGASGFAIGALQAAFADTGAQDWGVRASMTFQALMYLGHQLAGIPGRKNLIWFAGSFPIAIFPTADQLARMKQNPALPGYVDHVKMTADLFTVSQIAVYPISAEGLMSDHFGDADAVSPVSSATGIGHIGNHAADDVMSPYMASAGGRAGAIYAMEQLAASTGGKAFYNTNDLGAALKRVVNDGANYYTVGYSPTDAKMDGSFRQIDVKLAHQRFKLAYRHGYNADAGPASDSQSSVDPLAGVATPRTARSHNCVVWS